MKKAALSLITALLIIAATGALSQPGLANPYSPGGEKFPSEGAVPPLIFILSPKNGTAYGSNSVSLSFNASISEDTWMLTKVWYEVDWQESGTSVYRLDMSTADYIYDRTWITEFSYNETLKGIPKGSHRLTVFAEAEGSYVEGLTWYFFDISGSSSVNFTLDTTAPTISLLSSENTSYIDSEIPLNFTVSESVSRITYTLDNEVNVTVNGNTTLMGLPYGVHNVTVYAWDTAGNVGVSETLSFIIAEPGSFPSVPVAAASAASIAAVAAGLLLFRKKRRRQVEQA